MSGTAIAPVIAGLAVGIGLVAIFAMGVTPALNLHDAKASLSERTTISAVVIPKGATSSPSSGKNFEPSTIRVVIGVNNTVRWTNNDELPSWVVADNPGVDPDFAAKTQQFSSGIVYANGTNSFLLPGKSFEFTFNRPGEIHYYDIIHPWMQGTVIVLPPLPREVAALPCENAIISVSSNDTIYTCPHPPNFKPAGPIIFQLPAPTYRMVECNSTYGCSHRYNYQEIVPPNLLSDEQRKQVIDKVMSLPEVKMNAGWKLDSFTVQPSADRWTGHVQLFVAGIKQLPPSQECGWYGQVDVDLETLQVININNIPPRSDASCSTSQENNTSTATTITTSARSAYYSSYDGLEQVPTDRVLHGSYDGIDKDNGMVTINNQRYYLTTLNETVGEIKRGESIDFHNVTFSFPDGVFLTPGGIILIPDIKFQDGSEEVYGKSETFAGGGYMSGIGISSIPGASKEPVTVFTDHVHPQAALTLYNGSVKLLVSAD